MLPEVSDQVNNTVLRKEVHNSLAPRDPCLVEVQVQNPKDNGVLEKLQCLLKVRHVFQRQGWQVGSDERGPLTYGDYLAANHVPPVVSCMDSIPHPMERSLFIVPMPP